MVTTNADNGSWEEALGSKNPMPCLRALAVSTITL
jgi:hypothetical protein